MATSRPIAKYLISRYADPVFAVFIGFAAALLRIRNEEREKRAGLPSNSMVISPAQQRRIDEEQERRRAGRREFKEMYEEADYGSSETYGATDSSQNKSLDRKAEKDNVGYLDIIKLGWERAKWKADHEWYGRGKQFERKDGRIV